MRPCSKAGVPGEMNSVLRLIIPRFKKDKRRTTVGKKRGREQLERRTSREGKNIHFEPAQVHWRSLTDIRPS
jgi:hypothetical protein